MSDFTPPIPLSNPAIPAKAGIQTAANAAGTPANEQCQPPLGRAGIRLTGLIVRPQSRAYARRTPILTFPYKGGRDLSSAICT